MGKARQKIRGWKSTTSDIKLNLKEELDDLASKNKAWTRDLTTFIEDKLSRVGSIESVLTSMEDALQATTKKVHAVLQGLPMDRSKCQQSRRSKENRRKERTRMEEVGFRAAEQLVNQAVPGVEFDMEEMDIITDVMISTESLHKLKDLTINMAMLFLTTHNLLSFGATVELEKHLKICD